MMLQAPSNDLEISLSDTPRATIAGTLILMVSCLPLLGSLLLIPNLANMAEVFRTTPGLPLLISLTITAPGAMIGLLAPFAGLVSDRLGRKRLLVATCCVYTLVGVAPIFLQSLEAIVLSRILLGVCEAIVITVCTALIADYFEGARRVKYLSLQTAFTAISAVLFVLIGGAAAQGDWRTPFWAYTLGLIVAIPLAIFAWEPASRPTGPAATAPQPAPAPSLLLQRTLMQRMAAPVAFTLFSGIACNVMNINASFFLPARGFTQNPAAIGGVIALLQVMIAVAAVLFRWISRFGARRTLSFSYGLQALGFAMVAFADNLPATILGGGMANLAFGIQLPALITWALSWNRDIRLQGRISGLWTSAFWLGQLFFSFIYTGLARLLGDQFAAVGIFAAAAAIVAVLACVFVPKTTGHGQSAIGTSGH
jgi:MFS family permease